VRFLTSWVVVVVVVVWLLIQSTPEPRMYLDHEGNRKGDVGPS